MSLKDWMLGRMNRVITRSDLPPREPPLHMVGNVDAVLGETSPGRAQQTRTAPGLEHLGAYRPLIGAIREELERFVATELRLHLAIAEHDRYVLTAIAVESRVHADARQRLVRFNREFAPEQVKHYLAREIIARLPNASAIDLTQFAGLDTSANHAAVAPDTTYDALLAELRSDDPEAAKPYEVTLVGRWSDAERNAPAVVRPARASAAVPATPLAGRVLAVDVEDGDGVRQVNLAGVIPGRRYVVGKDADCDIVVKGTFASRRHCEIWLDRNAWWVTDCGSTNGVRVEAANVSVLRRPRVLASVGGDGKALEVAPGAHIVLSAAAQGEVALYPRVTLRPVETAPAHAAATPVTPIVAPRRAALAVTVHMAGGEKTLALTSDAPLRIGRSRTQELVVDWAHEGVSGHHVDLVARDETGVDVIVHGENGVSVNGTMHSAGARLHWRIGEIMRLGRAVQGEPDCTLVLSRVS